MNELTVSNIASGSRTIQSYRRNGNELGANPVEEYVSFIKNAPTQNSAIALNYPQSDLMILYLVANTAARFNIAMSTGNATFFNVTYDALSFIEFNLVLPKGDTMTITPLDTVSAFKVVGYQVSLIEAIAL